MDPYRYSRLASGVSVNTRVNNPIIISFCSTLQFLFTFYNYWNFNNIFVLSISSSFSTCPLTFQAANLNRSTHFRMSFGDNPSGFFLCNLPVFRISSECVTNSEQDKTSVGLLPFESGQAWKFKKTYAIQYKYVSTIRKVRFSRDVARVVKARIVNSILVGITERKTLPERPRHRREYNSKM
jgi:hypothetical protein